MRAVFLSLLLVSCGWTQGEVKCVKYNEKAEQKELEACKEAHGGKCPYDKIDEIMDRRDEEGEKCLSRY